MNKRLDANAVEASGILTAYWLPAMVGGLILLASMNGPALGQTTASAKPVVCGNHIASCGCVIKKKGRYDLDADLSSSQGLNPANDCLEVATSNVILNLGAHKITGPGLPNTDMGIVIKNGANNATVVGAAAFATISGWNVGLYNHGNNGSLSNIDASSNDIGIEFDHASGDRLTDWVANNEDTFGLWIRNGNNNFVTEGHANNDDIGILVGCKDLATTGGEDCGGAGKSSGNDLVDESVSSNTKYGIALDSNTTGSVINAVNGSSNGIDDLFDDNNACGSNEWVDNTGTKVDPTCTED